MKKTLKFLQILLVFILFSLIPANAVQSAFQTQNSIPSFPCYRNLAAINQSLQNLKSIYPDLVNLKEISSSWEGQAIYSIEITNKSINETKPRLVLVSGLRANAFAPVELSLRFAERILANYGNSTEDSWILDYLELDIIVLANPDGRSKAEHQASQNLEVSWQNNLHNSCQTKDLGVRLNLNFPFEWRESDDGACDPAYSGESPLSEPETQAIVSYLQDLKAEDDRILLLDLDAFGNEMLSPYRFDASADNDYIDQLYTIGKKISYKSLSEPYRQHETHHQATFGTLVDYAFGELEIPALVFSMGNAETGSYATKCWYFEENLLEPNLAVLKQALRLSVAPYQRAYGPDIEIESFDYQENGITISGRADDFTKWYNGADQFTSIKRIEYSLDLPTWHPQAEIFSVTKINQNPVYSFSASFELDLPFEGLTEGKHRIYFQAWDEESEFSASQPGIVSAVDFSVILPVDFNNLYLPIVRK